MAELQTITAVFDLLKLAWRAGVFLRKVRNADGVANEVCDRVDRLRSVLDGVRVVLERRHEHGIRSSATGNDSVESRICDSVLACHGFLSDLQLKVGNFDIATDPPPTLVDRFRVAYRQSSIARRQTDLDARINILQTELVILQLTEHADGQATVGANHCELLSGIAQLGHQVEKGNTLLQLMLQERAHLAVVSLTEHGQVDATHEHDDNAVLQLTDCLRTAEDLHERYTSDYAPGEGSIKIKNTDLPERSTDSAGALPETISHNSSMTSVLLSVDEMTCDEEEDIWPLEILNRLVDGYRERACREQLAGHYNQAELHLGQAIRHSHVREEHYGVPFVDRLSLDEDIAFLYQKQGKFAEAVGKVNQLLRDSSSANTARPDQDVQAGLVRARLHQLLGSIHLDRHARSQGHAYSNAVIDLEYAERHTKRAFNMRSKIIKLQELGPEDVQSQISCIDLLIRIFNLKGMSVEASELGKLLSDNSSVTSLSIRNVSTSISRSVPEYDMVEDKHGLLIDAIRSGESDQIQALLAFQDINLERCCPDGKTPLMHAVERSNGTAIGQLLDPKFGVDVNTAKRRKLTALHLAAQKGDNGMVMCLIRFDAMLDLKDRDDQTPLVKAVMGSHGDIIRTLSDHKADVLTQDVNGWSILHHAAHQSDVSIMELVLDIEPGLKDAVCLAGKTSLHHCVELGSLEHATVLLNHKNKLDVNAVDKRGRTPLYLAASGPSTMQRENMVRLLLTHGAQLDKSKLPPRWREYGSLSSLVSPITDRARSRRDSASTQSTSSTAATASTRLSTLFASRMRGR